MFTASGSTQSDGGKEKPPERTRGRNFERLKSEPMLIWVTQDVCVFTTSTFLKLWYGQIKTVFKNLV